ncbi:MAG: META domain-containing protein [Muribaculaceae bacterium]|nr:META domain-containing protein [Muribaculaceae bacterium]
MKTHIIACLTLFLTVTACTGNKTTADQNNTAVNETTVDIKGQWYLENIVFNDSVYVRPAEEVPGQRQYITFEDSTYFIQTNCNTFSGTYTLKGDSLSLGDGAMTEMACDNMATEEAIRKILPSIATVDIENDSIARLNSRTPSEYILLRKATEKK